MEKDLTQRANKETLDWLLIVKRRWTSEKWPRELHLEIGAVKNAQESIVKWL